MHVNPSGAPWSEKPPAIEKQINNLEAKAFNAHVWQHILREGFEAALAPHGECPDQWHFDASTATKARAARFLAIIQAPSVAPVLDRRPLQAFPSQPILVQVP